MVTLDIDECSMQVDDCEHNCNNTLGSYTCSCNDGYILDRDGIQCNGKNICHVPVVLYSCFPLLDIDECSLQLDECEQVCINLDGSHTCECNEGYAIVSNRYYACEGKPCRYYIH